MWSDLNTIISTLCLAVVLFGVLVILPVVERFFRHRELLHLRQQKAEALLHGHDPAQLDPAYLEHLQTMRLRDLQAVALQHGYDPLKLDPNYAFEVEENNTDEEDTNGPEKPLPHDDEHIPPQYIAGYQGQGGTRGEQKEGNWT